MQHGTKYYARRPPPPDPWGQKVKIQLSDDGHIAYKIKGNHECSNMVANILPAAPPPPSLGSKDQIYLLQNMIMLHIKLKGIANAATCWQIFCLQPPSPLRRSKFSFFRTWSCCTSKELRMQQHGSNCRQRNNKYETYQS